MKRTRKDPALVGVAGMRKELARLGKRVERLEGRRRRIGFQSTEIRGDREEQDDLDEDFTPDEVP